MTTSSTSPNGSNLTRDNDMENNWNKFIPIPAKLKNLKYGANQYLLFLSFLSPYHLIGIGLLASVILPNILIYVLSIVLVIYPLTKQILRHFNYLPMPYAEHIIHSMFTARCDGDFVVCLIGIRPNGANPFTKEFLEVGNAFRSMLLELESNPTLGYMGGDIYVGANDRKSTTLIVQYWRDYESLDRWTHTKMGIHMKTMITYMKEDRIKGINGVWHETYKVRDGEYEAIYVNMPPMGLALATHAVYETKTNNASERIERRKKEILAKSLEEN